MYIADKNITKSPLDIETGLSSEKVSESEIDDEFLNKNEELTSTEPEYDVEDDSDTPGESD